MRGSDAIVGTILAPHALVALSTAPFISATTSGAVRLAAAGIDRQLPPEVPTQIGIDYLALVEPKVLTDATTFVFLRRAAAFGER
jgi:hypothetical protein